MRVDCARCVELSDRLSLGEPLDASERAFVSAHVPACEDCAREAAFYATLAEATSKPSSKAEPVTRGDRGSRSDRESSRPRAVLERGRGARAPMAVALVALAAGVVIAVRSGRVAAPSPRAALPLAQVTLAQGQAQVDGDAAVAGLAVREGAAIVTTRGRACVRIDAGIRVCLAEDTRVSLERLAGPSRVVRLERGRVAAELEAQAPGSSFAIATRDGTSTAIGTAFSVEIDGGGAAPAVTRVTHGVVLVRARGAEERVSAHQVVRSGELARALPVPEEEADDELLREPARSPAEGLARVTLDSAPAGLRAQLDGLALGSTPVDVLVPAGTHTLDVEGFGSTPVSLREGDRLARTWTTRAPEPPSSPQAPTAAVRAAPPALEGEPQAASPVRQVASQAPPATSDETSAPSLLEAAQAARSRGAAAEAASSYRALVAAHPESREAHAALVSLGELELSGGREAEALADFDRYLAVGGALSLEARYGRIRALRRLGRERERREAVMSFLQDHGDSPQADALRRAP